MGRRSGEPLTQDQVNRMKPGQVLWDGAIPGLGVRRGESRITWRLKVPVARAGIRYTTKAGEERVRQFRVETLNPSSNMNLSEARNRARIVQGKITEEVGDPTAMRRRANAAEITLKQAWDRYVEGRKVRRFDKNGVEVQKPLSPKSIRDLQDTIRLYFGDWQDRTLAALAQDRDGFQARFYDLTEGRGGRTANKAVGHFRAVWRDIKGKLPELPDCPADAVSKLNAEYERKDAYTPEELPALATAILRAGNWRAGLHFFMLLSGCRATGVKTALRSDYDRENGTLLLREHKGSKHVVPLSPVMISLLDAMIELGDRYHEGTPYIFCGPSKPGHLKDTRINAPASGGLAARRAEIKRGVGSKIGSHVHRHTWVSLYKLAGIDESDARLMVGHAQRGGGAHAGYVAPIMSHLRQQQAKMSDYLMTVSGMGEDYRFTAKAFASFRAMTEVAGLI